MRFTGLSLDITTLRAGYRHGDFTVSDVVHELSRRLDNYFDKAVWIYRIPFDEVLRRAKELDAIRIQLKDPFEEYPLFGIPFGIKDNINAKDLPTTAACPRYEYIAFSAGRQEG